MAGRGRGRSGIARQTKSLDETTRPKLETQASLLSLPGRAGEEEEPKKRERKQPRPADDKPAAAARRQKSAEASAGRDKSPQLTAKTTKKRDAKEKEEERLLRTTLGALKIRTKEKAEASALINNLIIDIMEHLKKNTECFRAVQEPLRTGSYYENLKISHPDEFDVMMPMLVERVDIQRFGEDGAFYSVGLSRGGRNPLQRFQTEGSSHLSASEMLQDFRKEVIKCVKKHEDVEVTRKKKGCPAVTLLIREGELDLSLDVVLCLEVRSSWPSFTRGGLEVERWLGGKVKQQLKFQPFYLVPKYEGWGTVECDGVLAKDVWRLSFSHVEKAIMKNHGSMKTCCEAGGAKCCRKDCLKLLKHLLHLLKDQKKMFEKICSYHAKTTLLHACCSRGNDSDWEDSRLAECFRGLLEDFEGHLTEQKLKNFFIPAHNLLSNVSRRSCTSLASQIREQRERGFPIFMENEN